MFLLDYVYDSDLMKYLFCLMNKGGKCNVFWRRSSFKMILCVWDGLLELIEDENVVVTLKD